MVVTIIGAIFMRERLAIGLGKWRERSKLATRGLKRRRKSDEIMSESHGSDSDWGRRK